MKRYGFTMLELVFVIVVIGILAVLAMPSFQSNTIQRAAEQLATHIRYTQHLAIVDDKFNPTDQNYWNKRWRLALTGNSYTVTDSDQNATDPLTGEPIANINLQDEFQVTASPNRTIAFDNLGRPYSNLNSIYGGLMAADVNITLSHDSEGTATVTIHHETGYVQITY